jgi:hypothetical protein
MFPDSLAASRYGIEIVFLVLWSSGALRNYGLSRFYRPYAFAGDSLDLFRSLEHFDLTLRHEQ